MTQCHNHQHCIETALTDAEAACKKSGQRLTPLRKQVLELVWQSHQPLGAYELIDMLSAASQRRIAPPTIYRALEFLIEAGLIHRINALNAYIGCTSPSEKHPSYFFICTECNMASEVNNKEIEQQITQAGAQEGFRIQQQWLEVLGICQNCHTKANSN